MSKKLQLRGGTTSEHSSFTGAVREVTVDTDKDTLVVHDGSTAGGIPLAKASDLAAVDTDLLGDTSPQLGGNLDMNSKTIAGVSATEMGYLDGTTSDIQTQFGNKRFLPVAKSANYTAVDGDSIIITAGSITITLPASPTAGDTVVVKDGTGAAATTNWTVGRNSSKIASSATDLTFDKNWAEITMTYVNATIGWSV